MLRDVGIFMLGIAAFTMTIHYVFSRADPQMELQNAVNKSFTQSFPRNLAQTRR